MVTCEIRSQQDGIAFDLAKDLGGGGHPRAAGATVRGTLPEIKQRIVDWVARHPAPAG